MVSKRTASNDRGIIFQFHSVRGSNDSLIIKVLYQQVNGSRRLFWVFVAAVQVEIKNVSNPKLLLNIASQEHVSLVRWVDIYRYQDINPKSSRYNKDRTIPGLGVAAVLAVPVELEGSGARTRRSLLSPAKQVITCKLTTTDRQSLAAARETFRSAKEHLLSLVSATGSTPDSLKANRIIALFRDIGSFDHQQKAFFHDHEKLKRFLALDGVPSVPFADFPFQDVPGEYLLGRSPVNGSPVGFPRLADKRVLVSGGSAIERMFLALKFAASTGNRLLLLDLDRGSTTFSGGNWEAVLARRATVHELGNDCNLNAFSIAAPASVSTAAVTAYKASRMASYMIHSSDMDKYYKIIGHVRSLLSEAFGSAGTNTVTSLKMLEILENGISALRPNSQQEELVMVLVDSFKDYPEINAPVAVPVTSLVGGTTGHSWIRFTYQSLPVRKLVTLWVLHELVTSGLVGFTVVVNSIDRLIT